MLTLFLCVGLAAVAFFSGTDFSSLGGALVLGGSLALGPIIASILSGLRLGLRFAAAMVVYAGAAILHRTSGILRDDRADQHAAAAPGPFSAIALLFWKILTIVQSRR